jgi:hypothetical protein
MEKFPENIRKASSAVGKSYQGKLVGSQQIEKNCLRIVVTSIVYLHKPFWLYATMSYRTPVNLIININSSIVTQTIPE